MTAIAQHRPGLVIVDLSLNGQPGLDLIKDIASHYPNTKILVLSMHDESLWAERAIRAGTLAYVMKQEKPGVLMSAIQQAIAGNMWLSPRMTDKMLKKATRSRAAETDKQVEDDLGNRELQVLLLLGEGMNSRQIAEVLKISKKTVDAHREHIKRKLDLESSLDVMRYAVTRFAGK